MVQVVRFAHWDVQKLRFWPPLNQTLGRFKYARKLPNHNDTARHFSAQRFACSFGFLFKPAALSVLSPAGYLR